MPITMDAFETEIYEAAIVVQPLVGTLVYYSNHGRYEPRLAKSWNKIDEYTWKFELVPGAKCENGEAITPVSFKRSIERSIKRLSSYPIPILSTLVGYRKFLDGSKTIDGITSTTSTISFKFGTSVRSGLIQVLSFTPFGYICDENLNPNGTWKDKTKFISSGPYKVKEVQIGERYVIEKNPLWPNAFSDQSPAQAPL